MSTNSNFKKIFLFSFSLAGLFFIIGYLFWTNELQYVTPTEKPKNYVEVKIMDKVNLEEAFKSPNKKPFFIHYYNPYCPCSKFNYNYYQELSLKYQDEFNMFLVIREMDKDVVDEIKRKIKTKATLIIDEGGTIAEQTGVYSTPQAVLLNSDYTLYFRGNYNRTRYCTVKNFNFAEMAMDSLLAGNPAPEFGFFSNTAYGCSLSKEREFHQVLFSIN
ncbi:MAG: hypothetical protein OEW67_02960 [Cyclobacteriaceae bacterium]|nr:hypothetical protein [Cyclobacteriaceae bacterium]